LGAAHFFYSWAVFGLDYIYSLKKFLILYVRLPMHTTNSAVTYAIDLEFLSTFAYSYKSLSM